MPLESRLEELVEADPGILGKPLLAALWRLHSVAVMRSRRKPIRHPEVGLLEFDCQRLVDEERTQILALFSPVPGTPTAGRLALLASLGPLAAQHSFPE
ncbi:hypothetical protein [Actinacidiphila glaucinigra]|uniref:MmyB family transcriptional regulator n=1 Tax=Actinacidiphila glaucinigra TaxID=235986 RepID=UPI003D91FC30